LSHHFAQTHIHGINPEVEGGEASFSPGTKLAPTVIHFLRPKAYMWPSSALPCRCESSAAIVQPRFERWLVRASDTMSGDESHSAVSQHRYSAIRFGLAYLSTGKSKNATRTGLGQSQSQSEPTPDLDSRSRSNLEPALSPVLREPRP